MRIIMKKENALVVITNGRMITPIRKRKEL